jgi:hypothetical protein
MVPGTFSSGMISARNGKKAATAKGGAETESFITLELRTDVHPGKHDGFSSP